MNNFETSNGEPTLQNNSTNGESVQQLYEPEKTWKYCELPPEIEKAMQLCFKHNKKAFELLAR